MTFKDPVDPINFTAQDIADGRSEVISWDDLAASSTTLPEYADVARDLIKERLGYLPSPGVLLSIETSIRILLKAYHDGESSFDDMLNLVDDFIKLARNEDIRRTSTLNYDDSTYQLYRTFLSEFSIQVKERLSRFLGYTPSIEYSAEAEIFLRRILADDTVFLPETITSYDLQAITNIFYRKYLFELGKNSADNMPFVNQLF